MLGHPSNAARAAGACARSAFAYTGNHDAFTGLNAQRG